MFRLARVKFRELKGVVVFSPVGSSSSSSPSRSSLLDIGSGSIGFLCLFFICLMLVGVSLEVLSPNLRGWPVVVVVEDLSVLKNLLQALQFLNNSTTGRASEFCSAEVVVVVVVVVEDCAGGIFSTVVSETSGSVRTNSSKSSSFSAADIVMGS